MKVEWTTRAFEAVEQYAAYIARDDEDAAERWLEGILDLVRHLGDFPERGRVVPELGRPAVREVLYKSHRVIYRIRANVQIVSVRHQRRQLDLDELL